MPKIIQLPTHIANLIAAGEVVERPASVVKELLENAVDAGAKKITVEIRDGGMTFLRVTDDGCGMSPEDAKTAFLRHATSKLRTAEELASIGTMGFRGEALAAIASVSRIDLLTKTAGSLSGVSIHLEGGVITDETEAGCPDGTTIIIRDLFYNTPARMKFMKSDTIEGSRVFSAVQLQALAHPECAIRFLRDGKETLTTPGTGELAGAMYCVYGRDCAKMVPLDTRWEGYHLTGFVSKPTDARPSRNNQTFFVNDRPVRSKLLVAALEEAYRNRIMVGKFPACVLHLSLPASAVDVNVHPAKTEVKFLSDKAAFDCVHYGVLSVLNRVSDRPEVRFTQDHTSAAQAVQTPPEKATPSKGTPAPASPKPDFFRTMQPEQFKAFASAMKDAPRPNEKAAAAVAAKLPESAALPLRENVLLPRSAPVTPFPEPAAAQPFPLPKEPVPAPASAGKQEIQPEPVSREMEQTSIPLPESPSWRIVGELYRSYILVEQGDEAYFIDKHAAHERILFEKLKANQESITGQMLLTPLSVRLAPAAAGELLANLPLLAELGFEVEEFGDSTLLVRQIPMDLTPDDGAETLESLAAGLLDGKRDTPDNVRDTMLHTVACKAAIKAGWKSDPRELSALVEQVMGREDLKYCPHGRPICISLSKKQLEKQFKRT